LRYLRGLYGLWRYYLGHVNQLLILLYLHADEVPLMFLLPPAGLLSFLFLLYHLHLLVIIQIDFLYYHKLMPIYLHFDILLLFRLLLYRLIFALLFLLGIFVPEVPFTASLQHGDRVLSIFL
jgi:hypothetical protein